MTHVVTVRARAVLFDMDGTLVDSSAVVEELWGTFAERYGVDLGELLAYSHGRQALDTVRRFLPPDGPDPRRVAADRVTEELHRTDGVVEIPGARSLLERLADTPVAVVTSAPRELAVRRIEAAGLPPLKVLVGEEDVRTGKPSPEGYLRAADELGVPADHCVVFEDADAGIRAGVASGARTVVVGERPSAAADGLPRIADYRGVTLAGPAGGDAVELGLPTV